MFVLLRPVGLACQASCSYCYYKTGHAALRSLNGRMSMATVQALLDGLADFPEEAHTICLHGGEPLLIGRPWVAEFMKIVGQHPLTTQGILKVGVQSNGLAIDKEWAKLLAETRVDVSLSIDGPSAVHDAMRRERNGAATLDRILCGIEALREAGVQPSALAVVTKRSIEAGAKTLFDFFQRLGFREVDFTPYIETDASFDGSAMEPSADDLFIFYRELLETWLSQDGKNLLKIRTFEQTIGAVLGYFPTVCNMHVGEGCGRVPSVMPGGEVFACDLDPALVNVSLGSLHERRLIDLLDPSVMLRLREKIKDGFRSLGCDQCEAAGMCGMTCPRYSMSGRSMQQYCAFARNFLAHVRCRLDQVSRELFQEGIEFQDRRVRSAV